jgi:hypothetical protein
LFEWVNFWRAGIWEIGQFNGDITKIWPICANFKTAETHSYRCFPIEPSFLNENKLFHLLLTLQHFEFLISSPCYPCHREFVSVWHSSFLFGFQPTISLYQYLAKEKNTLLRTVLYSMCFWFWKLNLLFISSIIWQYILFLNRAGISLYQQNNIFCFWKKPCNRQHGKPFL